MQRKRERERERGNAGKGYAYRRNKGGRREMGDDGTVRKWRPGKEDGLSERKCGEGRKEKEGDSRG